MITYPTCTVLSETGEKSENKPLERTHEAASSGVRQHDKGLRQRSVNRESPWQPPQHVHKPASETLLGVHFKLGWVGWKRAGWKWNVAF